MRRQGSSKSSKSSSFNSAAVKDLFDSFLSDDPDEDRQTLTQESIIKFAHRLGIEDPEGDIRVLVLMWRLGANRRPGQISREEFESGLKALGLDSLEKIRKDLLPRLDVDFLQGDDFKRFYRFSFFFSLEGTRRNIEKDLVVELLPMVLGQRSEYTASFIDFLNETKKPEEMITADQWNQFYDFSQAYPTMDTLLKGYEEDASWPILLDEFVDYLRSKYVGGAAASINAETGGGGAAKKI